MSLTKYLWPNEGLMAQMDQLLWERSVRGRQTDFLGGSEPTSATDFHS